MPTKSATILLGMKVMPYTPISTSAMVVALEVREVLATAMKPMPARIKTTAMAMT